MLHTKKRPDQTESSKRAYKHNSCKGNAKMLIANIYRISNSDTTTPKTKQIARKMAELAEELIESLSERVD